MAALNPLLIANAVLALLACMLTVAVRSDLRRRRIPNKLVFAGAACALLLQSALPEGNGFASMLPGALGLSGALQGLGLGLLLLLPLYAMGALGAGDVKLMAMIGAFLGPQVTLVCVVLTFAAGGILIVGMTLFNRTFKAMLFNMRTMAMNSLHTIMLGQMPSFAHGQVTAGRMPYSGAIAGGTLACIMLIRTGHGDWLGL